MWNLIVFSRGSALLFFEWYGDHRDLHVLTHSFPTRRSSDLIMSEVQDFIRGTVTGNPVVLFMKGTAQFPQCGFSGRAIQILQARSEEHTSELQSLMRTSYAVFCLNKKNRRTTPQS